jgi:hypothetical protein
MSMITLILGVIIGFVVGMIVAAGSWRKALGKLGAYATDAANNPAPAVNNPAPAVNSPTPAAVHVATKTDVA